MIEQLYETTPFDELVMKEEPDLNKNDYREASILFTRLITLAMQYITTANNPLIASYGVSYALGLAVDGKSQREIAGIVGCSTGTISVHVQAFKKIANL